MMITIAPSSHKAALIFSLFLNLFLLIYLTFSPSAISPNYHTTMLPAQPLHQAQNSEPLQNFVFDCDITWNRDHGGTSKTDLQTTNQLVGNNKISGNFGNWGYVQYSSIKSQCLDN